MPSDLKARLRQEMTAALKGGEKVRLAALRLLSASVKNREVELGHELSDEEFLEIASREARRRRESIEAYEGAGRTDLVEREREELGVLESYLPPALSEEELSALVDEAIAETGAAGPKDMGKVMRAVMDRARGRADGATASALVRERLAARR